MSSHEYAPQGGNGAGQSSSSRAVKNSHPWDFFTYSKLGVGPMAPTPHVVSSPYANASGLAHAIQACTQGCEKPFHSPASQDPQYGFVFNPEDPKSALNLQKARFGGGEQERFMARRELLNSLSNAKLPSTQNYERAIKVAADKTLGVEERCCAINFLASLPEDREARHLLRQLLDDRGEHLVVRVYAANALRDDKSSETRKCFFDVLAQKVVLPKDSKQSVLVGCLRDICQAALK